MSEPACKEVPIETLRDWRTRLHGILEPNTRYLADQDAMKNAVIKQSAEVARRLIEEIEKEMGPYL